MEQNKLAGILSMCRCARMLAMGHDLVKESVQKGNAQLILFAQDISPKTEGDIEFIAQRDGVRCMKLPMTMDDLWRLLGKRIGVAAVTDPGFAGKLIGGND